MPTSLVYLRPVTVAAVRVKGAYGQSAEKAWQMMSDWLAASGMMSAATPRYGFLLDDPRVAPANECRYEACVPLPPSAGQLPWGFSVKRLPYGAYARARHSGGKIGIARTISKLRVEWTTTHGLVIDAARPLIEIYLDDPSKVPLDQQRVDLCLPVMFAEHDVPHLANQFTK